MGIKHDAPNNLYGDDRVDDFAHNHPTAERDGHLIPERDEFGYQIREQPYGTKRKIKVVLMGAGASTLNFLKVANEKMQNLEVVAYEKNRDVGGTWVRSRGNQPRVSEKSTDYTHFLVQYENRYPGCACDIPSVNYQFSWAIKLWTAFYSSSPEIWEYINGLYESYDLKKHVKLRHQITHAEWNEATGKWVLQVKNLESGEEFTDEAEYFINAGGVLNNFKMPEIDGLRDFKGKLMHSAAYEEGYDLKNKNIAVVGAGSSGVQIVAKIIPEVKQLYHWIRSPIWITAGFAQTWAGEDGANFKYNEDQLKFLEQNPKAYMEYRKQIENELNQRFKFIIKGSQEAKEAREFSYDQMARKLNNDKRLCDKIIPKNFNPGCRRPTPAPGYLEALVAPNAKIFTDAVQRFTETGFIDQDGKSHFCDVVICATGFDTSWLPRFPIRAFGKDIRDIWNEKDGVTSYLSIAVPEMPNHFTFCGPYGPLGHGSFMPLIERWTTYILDVIGKAQEENIKSFTPKMAPSRQFRQHADLFLQRTAWTSPCRSWFKQGKNDGQAAIYPGSRLHFLHLMDRVRYEDYEIEYFDDNIFAFLGNGFDTREFDGRDITNYLGNLDEEGRDVQPQYGEELMNSLAGWAIGM